MDFEGIPALILLLMSTFVEIFASFFWLFIYLLFVTSDLIVCAFYIIFKPELASLNQRNELATSCRHKKMFIMQQLAESMNSIAHH